MQRRMAVSMRLLGGLLATMLLGVADFLTGTEISFAVFYFVPVFFGAWYAGRIAALVLAAAATFAWLAADTAGGIYYSHPLILSWNAATRFLVYAVPAAIAVRLRESLGRERRLSRSDDLTRTVNGKHFEEILEDERRRCRRYSHPFTAMYIDVDDFRAFNDAKGHHAGDLLLKTAAQVLKDNVRKTDTVARVGGDEFAVLFPEMGFKAARVAGLKLKNRLLDAMGMKRYGTTFSVGAVTFISVPDTTDEVIRVAEETVRKAKEGGKNMVAQELFGDVREKVLAK